MIPIHVHPENLENVVNSLKLVKNFHGMTITIPHKQMISKFCEKLDDDALFTGAVNWIKFDKDRGLIEIILMDKVLSMVSSDKITPLKEKEYVFLAQAEQQ